MYQLNKWLHNILHLFLGQVFSSFFIFANIFASENIICRQLCICPVICHISSSFKVFFVLTLKHLVFKLQGEALVMWSLACSVCGVVAETRQIHMDYRVLWRKRDSMATHSRGKHPHPHLDRLLLLFWAHYIEDDPHLLCTGLLWVVTENKGEDVANYIKRGSIFANVKG